VPLVYKGTFKNIDVLRKVSEEESIVDKDTVREGIVIRNITK